MIWILSFAFLVLSGLTQAQEKHSSHARSQRGIQHRPNSFPYLHYPLGLPNDDLYTSSIVSYSSGPLCSGFHLARDKVVTAASCVYREIPSDLVVISHSSKHGQPFEYLTVRGISINNKYDPFTDMYDTAVLTVKNASHVSLIQLPRLNSNMDDEPESNVFMAKYTYVPEKMGYSTLTHPVEVDLDITKCTDKNYDEEVFLCVSRTDGTAYGYGLADLGTPLIYKTEQGTFLSGMFTGHRYNLHKTHYLYQNVHSNLEFLRSHIIDLY